jgi:LuxR family maltose regulon positive regulatory protein
MPRSLVHALIWSHEHKHYQLYSHGQPEQCFSPADGRAFARWLDDHTAFAFVGQAGRLSVLKEARRGGTGYWYAYRTHHRHTRKRYLGLTAQVTLARLEEVAKELTNEPSPPPLVSEPTAPPPEQKEALLSSKLAPPRLPLSLVERSRLLKELDAVCTHPLTLVSASAGSGKTTLLSAWAASFRQDKRLQAVGCGPALAWLSLEALDNSPVRFWASVIAALHTCLPRVGETALALLHSPEAPPLSICLSHLLNEIAQRSRELILVLDDYHVISDQAIHEAMLFLLNHLPANMHLVLATRIDPEFPLSRWCVRGQLLEIRSSELCFTRQEAADFLVQRMGLPLTEEDIASLHQRTEGWIAGLQLAALSLRKRQDLSGWVSDFAGSHRYLLDYVQQDILAQLPALHQQFLLQTSLLTRMNAAICQAVAALSSVQESQEMLEEMERANLFVVPLDEQRQWYRYHDLFREALRARLQASQPELVPLLHMRAARWYEEQGEWREAIEHALAAGEWERAAALIERMLTEELHPAMQERVTLLRWVKMLPEQVLETYPGLCVHYAGALLFTLDRCSPATMALIEEPLKRAEHAYELAEAWGKLGEALSCHAEVARWQGNIPLAQSLARRALTLPPEPPMLWRGASFLIVVASELRAGRPEEARRLTLEGQQLLETLQIPGYSLQGTTLMLGRICWQQGRLHQADQYYRQLLTAAQENPVNQMASRLGLAQVAYEWNHLLEAEQNVARVLELGEAYREELGKYFVEVGFLFPALLLQARLYQARGHLLQAHQALQQLLAFAQEHQLTSYYRMALAQQVELALATGSSTAVKDWQAISNSPDDAALVMQPEQEDLLRARILIACGEITEALHLLGTWQEEARTWRRLRSELEIQVLQALAYAASSRPAQAEQALKEALILAQPEGFQRLFLEKGEQLSTLLRTLFLDLHEKPLVSYVRGLLLAFASLEGEHQATPHAASALLLEPLTEAEQRVLGLLARGCTNLEIAASLVVSINTVKTQVQSIYRKLNVKSRWEASEAAHRLGLL